MGDFADMEIEAGIGSWRGSGTRGRSAQYWPDGPPLPPQYTHFAKRCRRCGFAPLYWERASGKWRLHDFQDGKFVLHSCALAAATGTAKTPQVAECEASQSGPKATPNHEAEYPTEEME